MTKIKINRTVNTSLKSIVVNFVSEPIIRKSSWGYRIDRPASMVHYWQWVKVGNVVKIQPVCGAMHPVHELQVAWVEDLVRNLCGACIEISGITLGNH